MKYIVSDENKREDGNRTGKWRLETEGGKRRGKLRSIGDVADIESIISR